MLSCARHWCHRLVCLCLSIELFSFLSLIPFLSLRVFLSFFRCVSLSLCTHTHTLSLLHLYVYSWVSLNNCLCFSLEQDCRKQYWARGGGAPWGPSSKQHHPDNIRVRSSHSMHPVCFPSLASLSCESLSLSVSHTHILSLSLSVSLSVSVSVSLSLEIYIYIYIYV